MSNVSQNAFLAGLSAPRDALARAVIRQMGGWSQFKESAPDIARHGVDGGFCGFIYYRDTVAFTKRNSAIILQAMRDDADSLGERGGVAAFMAGFGCLRGTSAAEIESGLLGDDESAQQQVYNAMAWYAAEEIARAYDDATES